VVNLVINGVSVPAWLALAAVVAVAAVVMLAVRARRRAQLQRSFRRAVFTARNVQRSVHPDVERLP
jgi:hypothetical protein